MSSQKIDLEFQDKKLPYPKSVFFILVNEVCERYSYYGMKTVLALYLSSVLNYNQDEATMIYHSFSVLCYFFPLIGAILADSFWGKFKTILYLSIVHALGNIILSFASIAIPAMPFKEISLLGLLLIAIGTGGIKPCVSSFGGDQFVLPQQALQLQQYFSIFYFCINIGALVSTFSTPILRNNVKCFGQEDCFPFAFGIPAILMVVALVIFICGMRSYVLESPKENVIVIFINCIGRALKNKFFNKHSDQNKKYWLEYADDKYSKTQISETSSVLSVLYLFIPIPLFWALADQQGSRWIFQATNLDGRVLGFTIKPDQMHVLNPLLILILIPIFELYIYPALTLVGIRRPLQKMVIGGFLCALAFVVSAILETYVEKSYAILPSVGEGQLRIYNNLNCRLNFEPPIQNINQLEPFSNTVFHNIASNKLATFKTKLSASQSCNFNPLDAEFDVYEKQTLSYFVSQKTDREFSLYRPAKFDILNKNSDGAAKIRFFYGTIFTKDVVLSLIGPEDSFKFVVNRNSPSTYHLFHPGFYDIKADDITILKNVEIHSGEIGTVMLFQDDKKMVGRIVNEVPYNTIHMLWQLPQIIIVTVAEVLFSITGLEFSFTQAPSNMKSVLSAAWLLTTSFGNLIVAVISETITFKSQVHQFLLFGGLMVLDMLLFILLSVKYRYVDLDTKCDEKNFIDDTNLESKQIHSTVVSE